MDTVGFAVIVTANRMTLSHPPEDCKVSVYKPLCVMTCPCHVKGGQAEIGARSTW